MLTTLTGMFTPDHQKFSDLIRQIVLPFYDIERDVPLPITKRRCESDAEHSWSLAFLACALAPQVDNKLDLGKISQFAIVHDIVEIYAGDTSNVSGDQGLMDSKEARETAALKRLEKEYKHFPWIIDTIHSYERKDSDEALFVYALDKYLPVYFDYLDQSKLFRERKVTLAEYNKMLTPHREKAQTHPLIGKYYDELRAVIDQHPEYFHQSNAI
jgi:5'-deoxynucleotidase YfbR-like HD superfamily hydrolase